MKVNRCLNPKAFSWPTVVKMYITEAHHKRYDAMRYKYKYIHVAPR